jgi:hypothetical protein
MNDANYSVTEYFVYRENKSNFRRDSRNKFLYNIYM